MKIRGFWKADPSLWDTINNVGLRNHYFCSVYAARLMVDQKSGLIVNISSIGGGTYLFGVAYGVGKAGCDRMALDMARELTPHGITVVSLWPGAVKTELMSRFARSGKLASDGIQSVRGVSFYMGKDKYHPDQLTHSFNIFYRGTLLKI